MFIHTLLILVAVHYTWGYNDENYPYSDDSDTYRNYPEDYEEQENDFEPMEKRNPSSFIRFGRTSNEVVPQPTHTRGLHIRFGRSKQEGFRLGRNMENKICRNDDHIRYGRSRPEFGSRSKRETSIEPETKRSDVHVRFGRNSDFIRYGRKRDMGGIPYDQQMVLTTPEYVKLLKLQQLYGSPLIKLFEQLDSGVRREDRRNII